MALALWLSYSLDLDLNKQDRGGATALHNAVQFASDDIVKFLLNDTRVKVPPSKIFVQHCRTL